MNRERVYFILGRYEDLIKKYPELKTGPSIPGKIEEYTNFIYDYQQKIFPSGRSVLLETNLKNGERFMMIPFDEWLGRLTRGKVNKVEFDDSTLDFLSDMQQITGYWPLRWVSLPVDEPEVIKT